MVFGVLRSPVLLIASFAFLFGILESAFVFVSDYANQHARTGIRATVLSGIGSSREVSKTLYKGGVAVALGVLALPNVIVIYGLVLVVGAATSYVLLRRAEITPN